MQADPKNQNRKGELGCCIDELEDYFMGENKYNTSEDQLIRYYDDFINQTAYCGCIWNLFLKRYSVYWDSAIQPQSRRG